MKNRITTLPRSVCALVLVSLSFSAFCDETLRGPGNWIRKDYDIAGEWEIVSRDNARFIVFDEDFATTAGPDLRIYLSTMPIADIGDNDVKPPSSIEIAILKSNKGAQEYALPANIDLDKYSSMLIHCKRHAHLWGGAALGAAPITVTPDPVTPDPVTPDPVTPDPVTPDPVTPDPVTPDPVTPDPVTPDPVTPDPVTPDPITTLPPPTTLTPSLIPTFGSESIPNQNWTRGQEIAPLSFPQATKGSGALTYTLTPAPPSGILYDSSARRLTGVPTGAHTPTQYTWMATDANGATATLIFTITITDVPQPRIQNAVRGALSALARRSLSSAITNISARFGDLGGAVTLAGHNIPLQGTRIPEDGHPCLTEGPSWPGSARSRCIIQSQGMRSADLLGSSHFSLLPGSGASPGTTRWSLWGRGDWSRFAGGEQSHYDGEMRTGWLGMDARADAWVAGLAVSRSEGEADYTTQEGEGELETTINGFYPYMRWTLDNELEIRAVAGTGDGEARHIPKDGALQTSDLSMRLGSLGLRRQLAPRGKTNLAFRMDAGRSRIKTQEGTERVHGLTADSWRLRAGVEASRRVHSSTGHELEPFLEVSVRRDGGDALRGTGMELAGGMRYQRPGLSIEGRARYLAAHSESGIRESGLSVTVRGGEGAGGRGQWFTLEPRWGADTKARALWDDVVPKTQDISRSALDVRIGYGLPLEKGLLTPFAGADLAKDSPRTVRVGTRFRSSRDLTLELVTERIEDTDREVRSLLKLNLRHSF